MRVYVQETLQVRSTQRYHASATSPPNLCKTENWKSKTRKRPPAPVLNPQNTKPPSATLVLLQNPASPHSFAKA